MKREKFIGAMLIATIIAASCSDSMEPNSTGGNSQMPKAITIGIDTPAETRLAHEYDGNASILKVNWKAGDKVRVFGTTGYTDYEAKDDGVDGKSVAFTAVDGGTASGESYNIFYPASRASDTWDATLLNMLGQMQTNTGETAHLADYTYLAKAGVNLSDPRGVQLNHQTAIIRFDFTGTGITSDDIRSITLSTQDAASFTTVQNAAGTTPETSKQQTIAVKTTGGGHTAVYMAVLPATFEAGKSICASFVPNDPTKKAFLHQANIGSNKKYQAGYVYNTTFPSSLKNNETNSFNSELVSEAPSTDSEGVYLIENPKHLKWLATNVNSGSHNSAGKKYKLTTDIWINSDVRWNPIGIKDHPFAGHFDGGGHTISGTMNFPDQTPYGGFFGNLEVAAGQSGSISNLHVAADISIVNMPTGSGTPRYAGIVGWIMSNGTVNIENCTYTGTISASTNHGLDSIYVAGIYNHDSGSEKPTIERCQAIGSITMTNALQYSIAGGIVGWNNANLHTSVAVMNYTGVPDEYKGQLVGVNQGKVFPCCWAPEGNAFGENQVPNPGDDTHHVAP